MDNRERQITLWIGEDRRPREPYYYFHVLLDGTPVASNQSLSPVDSQTVREISLRFSALFEQGSRPHQTADQLGSFSSTLFDSFFAGYWSTLSKRVPIGTRLLLVVASEVSDVLNLPWELTQPPGGDPIGCDPKFALRRLPRLAQSLPRFSGSLPARPLRVLFMACAPVDQVQLNYELEGHCLLQAIQKAGPDVTFYSGSLGTFEELRQRINVVRPQVVHLTGHGAVRENMGYFAFEDERGRTDLRSADEIRREFFAGSSVQCVFVSGCPSGEAPISALRRV